MSAFFFRELREELFHILRERLPVGDEQRVFGIDDDDIPESGSHDETFFPVDETIFACEVNVWTPYDLICEMTFCKESVERMPSADVIPFERGWDDESFFYGESFSEYGIDGGRLYLSE